MLQVNIILPTTQHDGTSNQAFIQMIERRLARLYGGYTAMPVSGGWLDEESGEFYHDESVMVTTFVDTQEQADQIVKDKAPLWARALKQIALTVSVHPVQVTYVAGTREQARHAA